MHKLTHVRPYLMEQFNEFNIIICISEIFLQKDVDARFKNEGIIDSNHTNALSLIPTGLSTTSDGCVHDIIRNQEESLKLQIKCKYILLFPFYTTYEFNKPTKDGGLEDIVFSDWFSLQDTNSVDNRDTTVQFTCKLIRYYTLIQTWSTLPPGTL